MSDPNSVPPTKEKLWWEIELEMQEKQQEKQDLKVVIQDPKTYLVNVTAACLLQESKYYDENDERRQIITRALLKVAETEPEFVCQLGVYVRNELYIRTTSNYIAAFCAVHEKTKPFIEKYFNKIVLLPNDLLEVCEFAQILYIFEATEFSNLWISKYLNKDVRKELTFKNTLQRCVRSKFLEFNEYQLGKYCTDSQRKKKNFNYLAVTNPEKWKEARNIKKQKLLLKIKEVEDKGKLKPASDESGARAPGIANKIAKRQKALKKAGKAPRVASSTLDAKYLTFKDLIKLCHISQPRLRIYKILGLKYPATSEEYSATFSDVDVVKEPFDATKSGKRMKIEVSTTWETELSSKGNSQAVWEGLIQENKLPYLALLRNLSNILKAGVQDVAHLAVINKLQDKKAVENSKTFPLQYFNAMQAVSEAVSKGFKAKKTSTEPLSKTLESVKEFVEKDSETQKMEEEQKVDEEQFVKVNAETGKLYIEALEQAIKIAVNKNLDEIEGHTAIFADVSGSMNSGITGGNRKYGTISTCLDCAVVLGLMIKQRSQKSSFYIFSSPGVNYKKCYLPVDLPGDDLKPSMDKILEEKEKLGGGTDFPYECINEWTANNTHVDNVVLLSDMMIAAGYSDIEVHGNSIVNSINEYKKKINPKLKVFAIDLESQGKCLNLGEEFNENSYFKIFGMSDSILKFLSTKNGNFNQVDYITQYATKKLSE